MLLTHVLCGDLCTYNAQLVSTKAHMQSLAGTTRVQIHSSSPGVLGGMNSVNAAHRPVEMCQYADKQQLTGEVEASKTGSLSGTAVCQRYHQQHKGATSCGQLQHVLRFRQPAYVESAVPLAMHSQQCV
jgi:hypothetical protein